MSDALQPQLVWSGATGVWIWCHLAAALLAAALLIHLARWERRLVAPSVGWSLLALRLTALGVVLLTLLQPMWTWSVSRTQTGRVVVAVDLSESMQTADRQAPPAERWRWARGLGLVGNEAQRAELDRWQAALDRLEQRAATEPPVTIAQATSPLVEEVVERLGRVTRLDIARRILLETQQPLWSALQPAGERELLVFAGGAQSLRPDQLREFAAAPPAALQTDSTRMASALQAATHSDAPAPVIGVILLTDGRDADAANAVALAQRLGQQQIPVYPVQIGSTHRPRDLAIVALDAPATVYRGDRPQIRAVLATSGFSGRELPVKLVRDDGAGEQVQPVVGADETVSVEFQLAAEEVGKQRYILQLPELPGETRTDNNRREFTIEVVDDRSRVLLVDEEPRWEFRYLEAALARDEKIDLQTVLFRQPYLGVLAENFFPRQWPTPADGGEPFSDRDLIILGDVAAERFRPETWQALERFVSEKKGTLVLLAGRERLPLGLPAPELARLLPITQPQRVSAPLGSLADPGLRGWSWQLTGEGEQQTSLQFAADAAANRALWTDLPGATWGVIGQPKPGANVWAWGVAAHGAGPPQPPVPLIVHQYYGLGQVVWIATDSTWRWRFRAGDQFHHRFWGQLARWAAQVKLSTGNEFVQFGVLKSEVRMGEPVTFQARFAVSLRDRAAQLTARVQLLRDGKPHSEIALTPAPDRPLTLSAQASGLPAGEYRARLSTQGTPAEMQPVEATFVVRAPPSIELGDLTAQRELLQQLADASGGRVFTPADVAELPPLLKPVRTALSAPQEQALWDRWPTLLLLAGLLTAEWLLRRTHGLP